MDTSSRLNRDDGYYITKKVNIQELCAILEEINARLTAIEDEIHNQKSNSMMTRKTSSSKSPHYILQNLNWEEGTRLAWSIKGNQIILTKVKDSSSTKEKHRHADLDAIDNALEKENQRSPDYDWYTVKEEAIKEYLESESEGKEYKDFDQQYESYLYSFSPEVQGSWDQGSKQQKDRTVSPPTNFPIFLEDISEKKKCWFMCRTRPKVYRSISTQVQMLSVYR